MYMQQYGWQIVLGDGILQPNSVLDLRFLIYWHG